MGSFKHGAKYSKWIYIGLIGTMSLCSLMCLITLILLIVFNENGQYTSDIYALIIAVCGFFICGAPWLAILLNEVFVVKKAIMKCITSSDAKRMTVVPFGYSEENIGLHTKYRVGVKFKYEGSKVTFLSKKLGVSRKLIGTKIDIVYSPSCDDIVLLKNNAN